MMGEIYRAAKQVLIFLGADDAGHGEHVRSLLKDMQYLIISGLEQASGVPNGFPYPEHDAPILKDARWQSFHLMLEQSWFSRGWVRLVCACSRLDIC